MIVGAGGGGYPAAFLLDQAGRSVAMADPHGNLGGNCLAEGCIPSKSIREAALERARASRLGDFGLSGRPPTVDWPAILAYKDRIQEHRYSQHRSELERSTIRFHRARAQIVEPDIVQLEDEGGVQLRYRFGHLILASGSAPTRLPIPGAELAITSHELFRLGADLPFPSRPIVVGGGYIGVEVGSMLEHLGAKPTILEATPELLPGFDPELAAGLHSALGERLSIHTEALVRAIERTSGKLRVRFEHAGKMKSCEGDVVIMATGRRAVLPDGVQALGLEGERAPRVDSQLRTQNARVYAPGDVNSRSMLFHSAVRQSLVAAHAILAGGQPADRFNFDAVPMTVFAEPEAAEVGLGEQSAAERFPAIEVARYDYGGDARAQIRQDTSGFIKLVVESYSGRLLGAQILGIDAAHLIAPLAQAVAGGQSVRDLASTAFPHPMLSEGIATAARRLAR